MRNIVEALYNNTVPMKFVGDWDASTATYPNAFKGAVYRVSVAGTVVGSPSASYNIGDFIMYDGTEWVTVGGAGGGGNGVKGVWDITPTTTPGSSTLDGILEPTLPLTDPNFASLSQNSNLITMATSLGNNTNPFPSVKSAGVFFDRLIDFTTDVTKSYCFRINCGQLTDFGGFTNTTTGIGIGYIEDVAGASPPITFSGALQALSDNLITPSYPLPAPYQNLDFFSLMVLFHNGTNVVASTMRVGSDGLDLNSDVLVHNLGVSNTIDVYFAYVPDAVVIGGTAGQAAVVQVAVINGSVATASINYAVGVTKSIRVFFSAEGIEIVGSGAPYVEETIVADLTGATSQLAYTLIGAPDQPTVDSIFGNPVPIFGTVVPPVTTQVSSLPVGAVADDLYFAYVNPAYTDPIYSVTPLGVFVRDGELIRVLDPAASPVPTFEVLNEYRNKGGDITIVTENFVALSGSNVGLDDFAVDVTVTADGFTVKPKSTSANMITSSFPSEVFSGSHFIPTAESEDLVYKPFRYELKLNPISTPRQTITVNTTSGSHEVVLTSWSDGFNGFQNATGGVGHYVGLNNYPFIIHEANGTAFPVTTSIVKAGVVFNAINATAPIVVGDILTNNGLQMVVTDVIGASPAMLIKAVPYASFSASQSFYDQVNSNFITTVSYQSYSQTVELTSVSDWLLYTNRPANATLTSITLVYDNPWAATTPITFGILSGLTGTYNPNEYPAPQYTAPLDLLSLDNAVEAAASYRLRGLDIQPVTDHYMVIVPPEISGMDGTNFYTFQARLQAKLGAFFGVLVVTGNTFYQSYIDITRLTGGYRMDLRYPHAVERDFANKSVTFRFRATNGSYYSQEFSAATIAAGTQYLGLSNTSVGTTAGTGASVYSGLGSFTTTAYTMEVLIKDDVTTLETRLIRGVDYSITATGELTFSSPIPVGKTIQWGWAPEVGTGIIITGGTPAAAAAAWTSYFNLVTTTSGFKANFSQAVGACDYVYNLGLTSWTLPNPNNYPAYTIELKRATAALGQLTIENESFDPSLQLDMNFQIVNTIIPVTSSGWFKNKYFTEGAYARWDGKRTVPFPELAPPVVLNSERTEINPDDTDTLGRAHVNNITRLTGANGAILYLPHIPQAKRNETMVVLNTSLSAYTIVPTTSPYAQQPIVSGATSIQAGEEATFRLVYIDTGNNNQQTWHVTVK